MEKVLEEIKRAKAKFGNFASTHEIYAVLQEEVDEFWDLVKNNSTGFWKIDRGDVLYFSPEERKRFMITELRQVAAVALRAAQELENNEVRFV